MDADFSHSPKDVPRLIDALKTHDAAMGSRYIKGGGISGWGITRQLISRGGNIYAQMILGTKYKDMTGGFNAWKKNVLDKIGLQNIRSRGYAYQVEMKYRAHQAGFEIAEVPIHFENRIHGISKMSGNIVWEAAGRVIKMRIKPGKS
jgi:dolichol-phosphate mannosyltransferase